MEEEYRKNGFVGPIDVLSMEEAAAIRQEFDEWRETLPDKKVVGNLRFKPHLFLPFANRIVRHPKLLEAVQRILGGTCDTILCWSSDFNVKEAGTPHYYAPHQDATYAGLEPANEVLTAWVALTESNKTTGCLQFWKGSHRHGQLPHYESNRRQDDNDSNNLLSRGQYCLVDDNSDPPIPVELRPGQASLHHFYTVHQSGPNNSSNSRIGLAIRYMTANVRQTGKTRESVTLVSAAGTMMTHQKDLFDLEPILPIDSPPTVQDIQRGMAAHADAMQREAANYFNDSYDGCIKNDDKNNTKQRKSYV